jgi:anti-anti-sigma factor
MITITKTYHEDKVTVTLSGSLETIAAPKLQEELIPEFDNYTNVEIDCSGIKYISSSGLRILLMAEKTAKLKKASMVLINVTSDVAEILDMTGFNSILTVR